MGVSKRLVQVVAVEPALLGPGGLSGRLVDVEPGLVIGVELFYPSFTKLFLKVGRSRVRIDLHGCHRVESDKLVFREKGKSEFLASVLLQWRSDRSSELYIVRFGLFA